MINDLACVIPRGDAAMVYSVTGIPANPGRELWCLAEDEAQPFLIRISPTNYIYDLEQLVLTNLQCTGFAQGFAKGFTDNRSPYRRVDRKDISLMKVRISRASCSQV